MEPSQCTRNCPPLDSTVLTLAVSNCPRDGMSPSGSGHSRRDEREIQERRHREERNGPPASVQHPACWRPYKDEIALVTRCNLPRPWSMGYWVTRFQTALSLPQIHTELQARSFRCCSWGPRPALGLKWCFVRKGGEGGRHNSVHLAHTHLCTPRVEGTRSERGGPRDFQLGSVQAAHPKTSKAPVSAHSILGCEWTTPKPTKRKVALSNLGCECATAR